MFFIIIHNDSVQSFSDCGSFYFSKHVMGKVVRCNSSLMSLDVLYCAVVLLMIAVESFVEMIVTS